MCCLFGLVDYKHTLTSSQKSKILSVLSVECEVRGTDATGVAYNAGGKLRIYKRPVPAHRLKVRIPEEASVVMGHARMTTQGSESRNRNNHPFPGRAGNINFALAHNGVLYNDSSLRRANNLPYTRIQTDSYVAVQLLEKKRAIDFVTLRYMAEQVNGSFSFTVLDERNNLYFVKGDNPLCIYRYPQSGIILYASTGEILERALRKLKLPLEKPEHLEISCGDIWRVDAKGNLSEVSFDTSHLFRSWYVPCYRPYDPFGVISGKPINSRGDTEDQYINDLKSLAGYFG